MSEYKELVKEIFSKIKEGFSDGTEETIFADIRFIGCGEKVTITFDEIDEERAYLFIYPVSVVSIIKNIENLPRPVFQLWVDNDEIRSILNLRNNTENLVEIIDFVFEDIALFKKLTAIHGLVGSCEKTKQNKTIGGCTMITAKRDNSVLSDSKETKEKCVGCPCADSAGGCLKEFIREKKNVGIGELPSLKKNSEKSELNSPEDEGERLATFG